MTTAPTGKSGKGSTALIVVLVILVVAVLGGVGYLLLKKDDDTPAALPTTPPVSSTAPVSGSSSAPAGRTVAHKTGKFSTVLPDNGWTVSSGETSSLAPGAPSMIVSPDIAVYKKGVGQVTGFAIVDLTGSNTTPEQYVATAAQRNTPECTWSKPKVFEYKEYKGTFVDLKACVAADGTKFDYDSIQLGVARADGTKVGMVIRDLPGETSTRLLALPALEALKHL